MILYFCIANNFCCIGIHIRAVFRFFWRLKRLVVYVYHYCKIFFFRVQKITFLSAAKLRYVLGPVWLERWWWRRKKCFTRVFFSFFLYFNTKHIYSNIDRHNTNRQFYNFRNPDTANSLLFRHALLWFKISYAKNFQCGVSESHIQ